MKQSPGNLWDFHARGYHVVVTTNIGWERQRWGGYPGKLVNNMGAGSVLEAARRWPELPHWYAMRCIEAVGHLPKVELSRRKMPVLKRDDLRLVFLPVKPLNLSSPQLSWAQLADMQLIESGLLQIREWLNGERRRGSSVKLAMTLPGAGNGNLNPGTVYGLVSDVLGSVDGLTLVDRQIEAARAAWAHATRSSDEWGSCVSCGGDRFVGELDRDGRCEGCSR